MDMPRYEIVELDIYDDFFFPTIEEYNTKDELRKRLQELLVTHQIIEISDQVYKNRRDTVCIALERKKQDI